MPDYDQAEIDKLVVCRKTVKEGPTKKDKLAGAHYRNDAKLLASDDAIKGDFSMFMRQSEDFPENFSVGLTYHPKDGRQDITLLRCNGQHGTFNNRMPHDADHPHYSYHVHRASEKALEEGRKAECWAETTAEFATFGEAVQYFIKAVNLDDADAEKYFPFDGQRMLF